MRELKGGAIDSNLTHERKERAWIIEEVLNVKEAEEMLKRAKEL